MNENDRRNVWVGATLVLIIALLLLTPLAALGLMRSGMITPAETTVPLGPVRLATTCYSQKRFCYSHENINPPPEELFVLVDWPGGERREDILLTVRIR